MGREAAHRGAGFCRRQLETSEMTKLTNFPTLNLDEDRTWCLLTLLTLAARSLML